MTPMINWRFTRIEGRIVCDKKIDTAFSIINSLYSTFRAVLKKFYDLVVTIPKNYIVDAEKPQNNIIIDK